MYYILCAYISDFRYVMQTPYGFAMRVETRLVRHISSRAAKRVNDKRATGINLSSFPADEVAISSW